MTHHLTTAFIVVAFVTLAVFGLYLPGHVGHEVHCPFSPGETAICANSLSHLKHWQSAFTAVLMELLVLIGVVFAVFFWFEPPIDPRTQLERYRLRQRAPLRPTLFQELYSKGILNRKEPPR